MRRGGLGKVEGAGWKGQGATFLSQRFWASRIPFLALTIGINQSDSYLFPKLENTDIILLPCFSFHFKHWLTLYQDDPIIIISWQAGYGDQGQVM